MYTSKPRGTDIHINVQYIFNFYHKTGKGFRPSHVRMLRHISDFILYLRYTKRRENTRNLKLITSHQLKYNMDCGVLSTAVPWTQSPWTKWGNQTKLCDRISATNKSHFLFFVFFCTLISLLFPMFLYSGVTLNPAALLLQMLMLAKKKKKSITAEISFFLLIRFSIHEKESRKKTFIVATTTLGATLSCINVHRNWNQRTQGNRKKKGKSLTV